MLVQREGKGRGRKGGAVSRDKRLRYITTDGSKRVKYRLKILHDPKEHFICLLDITDRDDVEGDRQ